MTGSEGKKRTELNENILGGAANLARKEENIRHLHNMALIRDQARSINREETDVRRHQRLQESVLWGTNPDLEDYGDEDEMMIGGDININVPDASQAAEIARQLQGKGAIVNDAAGNPSPPAASPVERQSSTDAKLDKLIDLIANDRQSPSQEQVVDTPPQTFTPDPIDYHANKKRGRTWGEFAQQNALPLAACGMLACGACGYAVSQANKPEPVVMESIESVEEVTQESESSETTETIDLTEDDVRPPAMKLIYEPPWLEVETVPPRELRSTKQKPDLPEAKGPPKPAALEPSKAELQKLLLFEET